MPKGERRRIPIDRLDVSVPEHLAPEGVFRLIKNLCPMGPAGIEFSPGAAHYWSPVESEQVRTAGGYLGLVRQTRNQVGPLSDTAGDPSQTLERLVGLTASELKVIDPGQASGTAWAEKTIHTFAESNAERRLQGAQIGEALWLAMTRPAPAALRQVDQGDPEPLLEVTDDAVLPLVPPPLPYVADSVGATTASTALAAGVYLYRYGWALKDGTYLGAGVPSTVVVSGTEKIIFTVVDGYREALSTEWQEKIKGIAVYLTGGPQSTTVLGETIGKQMEAPYFRIGVLDLAVSSTLEFSDKEDAVLSYPAYDEATIIHGVGSGAAFAYNGRLWLGDVAYDYAAPDVLHLINNINRTNFPPTGTNQIRLGVTIKTDKGTFTRIGEPATITGALSAMSWVTNGPIYVDRRATEMRAYASTDSGATWYHSNTWVLRPSGNLNLAFRSVLVTFDATTNLGAMPDVEATNATRDRDVNRFLVSGVLRPRDLSFAREYQASSDPTDVVVGFASNALPSDQGQYGQFPVYIGCTESIRAVEVGSDGLPARIVPFTTLHHFISRQGFTNAGRTIAFAARSGVYVLPPGAPEPIRISEPLHYETITELDFYACMTPDVATGFYADLARGREEVWVASGVLTFAYSIRHGRWFIMERERSAFRDFSGRLLGIDQNGAVTEEGARRVEIEYELRSARTGLGYLGAWKRLHQVTLRQRVQLTTAALECLDVDPDGSDISRFIATVNAPGRDARMIAAGMVLEPSFRVSGLGLPGQAIEYIELLSEPRYLHRAPQTVAQAQSAAGGLTITGTPWTCAGGIEEPPGTGGGAGTPGVWIAFFGQVTIDGGSGAAGIHVFKADDPYRTWYTMWPGLYGVQTSTPNANRRINLGRMEIHEVPSPTTGQPEAWCYYGCDEILTGDTSNDSEIRRFRLRGGQDDERVHLSTTQTSQALGGTHVSRWKNNVTGKMQLLWRPGSSFKTINEDETSDTLLLAVQASFADLQLARNGPSEGSIRYFFTIATSSGAVQTRRLSDALLIVQAFTRAVALEARAGDQEGEALYFKRKDAASPTFYEHRKTGLFLVGDELLKGDLPHISNFEGLCYEGAGDHFYTASRSTAGVHGILRYSGEAHTDETLAFDLGGTGARVATMTCLKTTALPKTSTVASLFVVRDGASDLVERSTNAAGGGMATIAALTNGRACWWDEAGGKLYVAFEAADKIVQMNADGTGQLDWATGEDGAYGLWSDGARLYWSNTVARTIRRATLGGATATDAATIHTGVDARHLSGDLAAGLLYWADPVAGKLWRGALAGGGATTEVAALTNCQTCMVEPSGTYVYFMASDQDDIWRRRIDLGEAAEIAYLMAEHGAASNEGGEQMALDATGNCIYFGSKTYLWRFFHSLSGLKGGEGRSNGLTRLRSQSSATYRGIALRHTT